MLNLRPRPSLGSGFFRFTSALCLLAVAFWLSGCDQSPRTKGLEAVYDGERYRITLHEEQGQQTLSVMDHRTGQTVIEAPTAMLISAYQTDLSFTESHASFEHHAQINHRCQQAKVDKAEPTSHYFLIAGVFESPNCPQRFSLRFTQDEHQLRVIATTSDADYNHLKLTLNAPREEAILGFGAQVSRRDFKGIDVPIWIQEQGIGRGAQPLSTLINANVAGAAGHELSSYFTVPYFVSSAGYTWFLENTNFSRFDFRNRQKLQIHSYGQTLKARFSACEKTLECITRYSDYSGRMKPLPDWAHKGAIVGLQGGTEQVMSHYQTLRDADTPIAALWLQDWVGRRITMGGTASQLWWNWERDETLYPDWGDMVKRLKKDGVRVMGYFNPFLVDVSEKHSHKRNLYQEALDNNYLVRDREGNPYQIDITDFAAGLVDLSNPNAFDWLKKIIKQQVRQQGFSGWMADFGEALPAEAVLSSGDDALEFHNRFPQEWARLNAEVVKELRLQDDAVFFMRAGFSQSPAFASLFWLGDQNTSWDHHDGLQSVVIGLMNSGISAQSLNHADIGGYTSLRRPVPSAASWLLPEELTLIQKTPEQEVTQFALRRAENLLLRWIEMSAFTPVFRTHEGLTPDINAQVYQGEPAVSSFAHNARLFAALQPYRQFLMQQAEQYGWPLVRHPLLHYPQHGYFQTMPNDDLQFMFGEYMMVAPVLTPKNQRGSRQVFLPKGRWLDINSGDTLDISADGRMMRITPTLGQAPAYVLLTEDSERLIIEPLRNAGFVQ